MTGLAGIASLRGQLDIRGAAARVETMGRLQSHRAPDGWCVVAHAGLTYVGPRSGSSPDRTEQASDRTDALVLAFDGVITNRDNVREALGREGAQPNGDSDRELVLGAWACWGPYCLERLRGRFAFAIRDPGRDATYLVRDRFGHKPFQYAIQGDHLYFASEIKALLGVMSSPAPDERALIEWSLYGDLLPPRTLFRGIRTLPQGHLLEASADNRRLESHAYYELAKQVDPARYAENARRPVAEIQTTLESTLDEVVSSQMHGRHDVGIMLSGGVDSAVIGAMAARHENVPAYNFSVAGDPRLDERPMAQEVARALGLSLHSIVVDREMYGRELAHTTHANEIPVWHMQCVPIQLLARRAREDGIGLLLSGVSVGPLLGAATSRQRWILPPPFLGRLPDSAFRVARKAVYAGSGLPVANPGFTHTLGVGLDLVDGGARSRLVSSCRATYAFLADVRERRPQVMRLSDHHLFSPRFYHQGDRLCMAESIEYCDASVQAPFMSLAVNLPTELILHKGKPKWILKELATRYIPRDVAFQKKIPLDVPVEQYFTPLFRPSLFKDGFLAELLGFSWASAQKQLARERERVPLMFQLVNIEVWGRLFFMQQSIDEVTRLLSCERREEEL